MNGNQMNAQMIAALERNTAAMERLAALLESGAAVAGDSQETAVTGQFPAIDLSAALLDGKIYWKVRGGKYSRHGLTLWPEMAAAHGFDLDSLNIQQKYPLTGWTVVYTDGDPPRIANMIPPETAVSRQPQKPVTSQPPRPTPPAPEPVQATGTNSNVRFASFEPGERVRVQGNNETKLATVNYFSRDNNMVSVSIDGQAFTVSADRVVAKV